MRANASPLARIRLVLSRTGILAIFPRMDQFNSIKPSCKTTTFPQFNWKVHVQGVNKYSWYF